MSNEQGPGRPRFDPQTGQPIYDQPQAPQNAPRFDTQTGQPIYGQPQAPQGAPRFDTQTGQPLYGQPQAPQGAPRFDTQTGQPLYGQPQAPQGAPRFDTQTGQPVYGGGQTPPPAKRGGFMAGGRRLPKKWLALCIAAVAAAGIAVAAGVILSRPAVKIGLAAKRTFVADDMTKQLTGLKDAVEDLSFSLDANVSVPYEGSISIDYSQQSGSRAEQSLSFSYPAQNISFSEYLDGSAVYLDAPGLLPRPVSYNYRNESNTLPALIGQEEDMRAVNSALSILYGMLESGGNTSKKTESTVLRHLKELSWEKTDKRYFSVRGKNVNCAAYRTTIDTDFIADLLQDVTDTDTGEFSDDMVRELNDLADILSYTGIYIDDYTDLFAYAYDGLRDSDFTMDLTICLGGGRIAAAEAQIGGIDSYGMGGGRFSVTAEFRGVDVAWHDTQIDIAGMATAFLNVSESGTLEDYSFGVSSMGRTEQATLSYDTRSHDYAVYYDGERLLNGFLESGKGTFSLTAYVEDFSLDLTVSDKPDVTRIGGDFFELTTATQQELEDFGRSAFGFDAIYDMGF